MGVRLLTSRSHHPSLFDCGKMKKKPRKLQRSIYYHPAYSQRHCTEMPGSASSFFPYYNNLPQPATATKPVCSLGLLSPCHPAVQELGSSVSFCTCSGESRLMAVSPVAVVTGKVIGNRPGSLQSQQPALFPGTCPCAGEGSRRGGI